ncbi:hypothetical protein KOR42_54280 [Thalassoglobus neptunius]|uniref:Uncharacterized protein n=1 Tax=Thalassoglobus neptunius TaxID=1938619 RepID=A0A5C5UVW4_9PLAN|nr:hypothetical protein KOR42_54280 [Thalassoglobus neptunius]
MDGRPVNTTPVVVVSFAVRDQITTGIGIVLLDGESPVKIVVGVFFVEVEFPVC